MVIKEIKSFKNSQNISESLFVFRIEKYSPCDGCRLCEDACYNAGTAQRIKKMDWKLLEQHGHSGVIRPQTAIGEIPPTCGQTKSGDFWPMIYSELCDGCGACASVCSAIHKVKREFHR